MNYKYITDNNLENKQNYMYSEYGGQDFVDAYIESRKNAIKLEHTFGEGGVKHNTYKELMEIRDDINCKFTLGDENKVKIDAYVKSFEVRKRLYAGYDDKWKPCVNIYSNYELYLLMSEILIEVYSKSRILKYVSCLLKITDSLISVANNLNEIEIYRLADILKNELRLIEQINGKAEGI